MKKELFIVWYDPQIGEIMNIKKSDMTEGLSSQLKKEGIETVEILEENLKAANQLYLENIESTKQGEKFMPTYNEIEQQPTSKPKLH